MDKSTKGKHALQRGYAFEERVYQLIKCFLKGDSDIYRNVRIPFENTWREADIIFFWNKTCFIIECKQRKGMSVEGRTTKFWLPSQHCQNLCVDGYNATRQYLSKLWQVKEAIKHHRLYKSYDDPHIRTILLIDGLLQVKGTTDQYAYVSDTYITTIQDFPYYLNALNNLTDTPTPTLAEGQGGLPHEVFFDEVKAKPPKPNNNTHTRKTPLFPVEVPQEILGQNISYGTPTTK